MVNDTSVVEQAVQLWRKRSSFSKANDNIDYDPRGEVSTTRPGWTSLVSNSRWLPEVEPIHVGERVIPNQTVDEVGEEEHCAGG